MSGEESADVVLGIVYLVGVVFVLAGLWKTYTKAGKPGWAAIVPIYNMIVLIEIAGKPMWWLLLLLVPLVNIFVGVAIAIGVAERFGKGTGFGLGLAFLGFIFYPILGFGNSQYKMPETSAA